nr:hypothetical protein [Tanacetum cinerariifolium]
MPKNKGFLTNSKCKCNITNFSQQQQQQQLNQPNGSQPQSDQQSFHLVDETEDEDEPLPTLTSKKTRGTRLKQKAKKTKKRNHKRNRNEPGICGAKTRSSSNSTVSSGSNPLMYQEMMKEQYELDHKAIMEVIEREANSRIILCNSQKIAEDMKVLQITPAGWIRQTRLSSTPKKSGRYITHKLVDAVVVNFMFYLI